MSKSSINTYEDDLVFAGRETRHERRETGNETSDKRQERTREGERRERVGGNSKGIEFS